MRAEAHRWSVPAAILCHQVQVRSRLVTQHLRSGSSFSARPQDRARGATGGARCGLALPEAHHDEVGPASRSRLPGYSASDPYPSAFASNSSARTPNRRMFSIRSSLPVSSVIASEKPGPVTAMQVWPDLSP